MKHCSFFFNDTATTEIYTLSLHDALPISTAPRSLRNFGNCGRNNRPKQLRSDDRGRTSGKKLWSQRSAARHVDPGGAGRNYDVGRAKRRRQNDNCKSFGGTR